MSTDCGRIKEGQGGLSVSKSIIKMVIDNDRCKLRGARVKMRPETALCPDDCKVRADE